MLMETAWLCNRDDVGMVKMFVIMKVFHFMIAPQIPKYCKSPSGIVKAQYV